MRTAASRYRLVYWDSVKHDSRSVAAGWAMGWLRDWLVDPEHRAEVIEVCSWLGPGVARSKGLMDERDLNQFVRPMIERALLTGELLLVDRAPKASSMPSISGQPGKEATAGAAGTAGAASGGSAKPSKTWIELLVTDMAGEPVADVKYEAKLADGTKKEGKTDAKGLARFDEIEPGLCEFKLVEYDGEAFESLDEASRREKAGATAPKTARPVPPPVKTEQEEQEEEVFVLAGALQWIGELPLVNHLVRILDPDTGARVGEELTTDDEGVVRAEVPERKDYRIEIVEKDLEIPEPPAPLPEPKHAVLVCEFVDSEGKALAGVPVAVDADGDSDDATVETDEDGRIEAPAPLGPCRLKVRGQEFVAHSLPVADSQAEENTYRFVVEAK